MRSPGTEQSTFRWKGEKLVVYIDSWGSRGTSLRRTCSSSRTRMAITTPRTTSRKVKAKKTVIVVAARRREGALGDIKPVKPGDRLDVAGVKIEAVPATTSTRLARGPPERNNWVGYVRQLGGTPITTRATRSPARARPDPHRRRIPADRRWWLRHDRRRGRRHGQGAEAEDAVRCTSGSTRGRRTRRWGAVQEGCISHRRESVHPGPSIRQRVREYPRVIWRRP